MGGFKIILDRNDLTLTRLYYFLFYGGTGFMSPFLNLFLIQRGLDGTQIGWATSIFAFVTLIAAPFWTSRNTHWRSPLGILQLFLVLTGLSYLWLTAQTLFWAVALVKVVRSMLSSVVEIPCMLWADRLVTRRGAYPIMLVSMLIYVGLRLSVLFVPAIVTVLAMRALQGFAFSFYTVALIRFIGEQTTPHETRTVLALYTITLTNLVTIIGSPLTGMAFDRFGTRPLYLLAAAGYFLAWLSLFIARKPTEPKLAP